MRERGRAGRSNVQHLIALKTCSRPTLGTCCARGRALSEVAMLRVEVTGMASAVLEVRNQASQPLFFVVYHLPVFENQMFLSKIRAVLS